MKAAHDRLACTSEIPPLLCTFCGGADSLLMPGRIALILPVVMESRCVTIPEAADIEPRKVHTQEKRWKCVLLLKLLFSVKRLHPGDTVMPSPGRTAQKCAISPSSAPGGRQQSPGLPQRAALREPSRTSSGTSTASFHPSEHAPFFLTICRAL